MNTRISKFFTMGLLLSFLLALACGKEPETTGKLDSMPTPEILEAHCRDTVGAPRVERISEHVWAAMGFDLANTVLVQTPAGYIVIDPGMSPKRAHTMKQALEAIVPPGPVAAVVYTHSHVDHVGGGIGVGGKRSTNMVHRRLAGTPAQTISGFLAYRNCTWTASIWMACACGGPSVLSHWKKGRSRGRFSKRHASADPHVFRKENPGFFRI